MNIATQGLANTLPFCVTDLRAFMQHLSPVTGVHVHVIDAASGKVFLEGTHGNWELYAPVHNTVTGVMEDELIDLEHLLSYPDPSFQIPENLTPDELVDLTVPRITFLQPGEYVLFQYVGVRDGQPVSGVYGVNSDMESVSYDLNELVNRACAVLGTPEEGSLLNPHQASEPDTSGPAI